MIGAALLRDTLALVRDVVCEQPRGDRANRVGCDGFLAKPVDQERLLQTIASSLALAWIYPEADRASRRESPGAVAHGAVVLRRARR